MIATLYSKDELDDLRQMPKRVTNPGARWSDKPGHKQKNYQVSGDDQNVRFQVYLRQNLRDDRDFSCGIAYIPLTGRRLTLARYNGPSHRHGDIVFRPHIHRATVSAIAAGKKPESQADVTDRFETLDGALRCLIDDYHLQGLTPPAYDEPRLEL